MSRGSHPLSSLLLAAALASSLAGFACASHHYYRVYDPYYTDYHVWNDQEDRAYRMYLQENRREYVEYPKVKTTEQTEYWKWRHEHPDDDRDRH